jgi:anti-sigma B factor antagonist
MSLRAGRAPHGRDDFRIRSSRLDDGVVVIEVSGELDICSSHTVRETLATSLSGASRLVVDLSGLRFIDSTGIGLLAMAVRRLALEAGLAIVCPGGRVRKTLALTGLDRLVPIYSTQNEALCSEAVA